MRLIYIYPSLTTVGGADRVIVDKANYFAEKCGYEVYIVTAHQNGQPSFFPLSEKVKHIDLGVNFNEQYRHSFFVRGFIYLKLLRIYKKKLSNVLNELKADFTLTTISRDIDFLHSIKDGSIKIAESHAPKQYVRNLHLMQNRNFLYQISGKIWIKKLEKAAKKFAAFVVLTQKDADSWSGVRSSTIIPNSLPFFPQQESNCKGKQIISVGRLYAEKGYDRLIEAWEIVAPKYPDWKINIYGNGELRGYLTELINKKGLSDSLILKDPVNNIIDKYVESSFYVMSSRFEGFGMVLIEAMACGLPVISFDCPMGPSNIINNNEDGFLVKDGDIQQFAEKICYLIDHEGIRIQMGQKARENVKRYNQETIMQKWIELFQSLKN
ncbi:MAG: glycosyltransferase family 4 protein [Bacteroidales bacterium]